MTRELLMANSFFAAFCTLFCSMMGGWSMALQFLVCLIVADYITGLAVGWSFKELCSQTGFRGIIKKVVILMMVAIGSQADLMLGTNFIRDITIYFYISNEGISVLENTTKLGVPYPQAIKDALTQVKNMQKGAVDENSN